MKKDLLQQISERLNSKGFTEGRSEDLLSSDRKPYEVGHGLMKQFEWLPEENLKKIAEFDISQYKDFNSVYQAWGRKGFFKFVPYLTDMDDNPTLVLKHNKFMHMFRGYYFQISGTHTGVGECNKGSFRTSGLLDVLRGMLNYADGHADSHLLFILMYSAMIDCGFQNDNFRYAFYDHTDVIDKFFTASMKWWNVDFPYDSSLLQQYISYKDGTLEQNGITDDVYEIAFKDEVCCRFSMLHDEVCVEYNPTTELAQSRIVTFNLPDLLVGIPQHIIDRWDEYDEEDFRDSVKNAIHKSETNEQWVLLMLLKMVGIHTCFMATYPIKKIGAIPKYVDNTCKRFEDLNWK